MNHLWLVVLIFALEVFKVETSLSKNIPFCGRRTPPKPTDVLDSLKNAKRIVGGNGSKQGSWPWQVALLNNGVQQCAGSLIDKNWIVTAAHCVLFPENTVDKPEAWTAALGEHTLGLKEEFEQIKQIELIIRHPNFDFKVEEGKVLYVDNDIALFMLKTPATFNEYVQPICLLRQNMTFPPGKECYVTGWGHTMWQGSQPDALREVKIKLVSPEVCNRNISYGGFIHDVALCAGAPGGEVGSCQYDSGGPLSCDDKQGRFYLTGVVSWGYECARPHKYDVYANMMALTPWVRETIKEAGKKSKV